jgi:hypothetical protein
MREIDGTLMQRFAFEDPWRGQQPLGCPADTTGMPRIAYLILLVFVLALAGGAIVVTTQHSELAQLRHAEAERAHFCLYYRSGVEMTRLGLDHAFRSTIRRDMDTVAELTMPPYFDLCHVDRIRLYPTITLAEACYVQGDVPCLARILDTVLAAMPRS